MGIRFAGRIFSHKITIYKMLTSILGIGLTKANSIITELGIHRNLLLEFLTNAQCKNLNTLIHASGAIEGKLQQVYTLNLEEMLVLYSYRSLRFQAGLPVRGQRTHSNARTQRKNPNITLLNTLRANN
jgi:small subunit ribosomal protein S13